MWSTWMVFPPPCDSLRQICCIVSLSIYYGNHNFCWIQSFLHLQTWPVRECVVVPTFETSVQRVFKGFIWFLKQSYNTFQLLPSRIKNRMFQNWIHFLLILSVLLKINMGKTPEKVTKDKDPKRVETPRKGREKYMNKLKESILNDVKKDSGDTTNASVTKTATTRSNDTYVYGVGILAVLTIGVCVCFTYNNSQAKTKKSPMKKNRINHQKDVLCFRKSL